MARPRKTVQKDSIKPEPKKRGRKKKEVDTKTKKKEVKVKVKKKEVEKKPSTEKRISAGAADFSRVFNKKLKELSCTQNQYADKIGVSYALISSWSRGNSLPTGERFIEIVRDLNLSDALFSKGKEKKDNNENLHDKVNELNSNVNVLSEAILTLKKDVENNNKEKSFVSDDLLKELDKISDKALSKCVKRRITDYILS